MNLVLPEGQCNKPMKYGHIYFNRLKGWLKVYTCSEGHSIEVHKLITPKWCMEITGIEQQPNNKEIT